MKIFCKAVMAFFAAFTFFTFTIINTFAEPSLSSVDKIKQDGFITMSTNAPFEPFEYLENNDIKGIDVDIAQKIVIQFLIYKYKNGKSK